MFVLLSANTRHSLQMKLSLPSLSLVERIMVAAQQLLGEVSEEADVVDEIASEEPLRLLEEAV